MPTLIMGPGAAEVGGLANVDLTTLLASATVTETSTDFSMDAGGLDVSFEGTGFTYDFFGMPTGGLITDFNATYDGEMVFDLSGFSVPVTQVVDWVLNGDATDAVNSMLAGADTMVGSSANDVLGGSASNESVTGGAGDDTISAVAGINYLRGDDGNDSIQGGTGFDDINGNKGDDTIAGHSLVGDWLVGGQGNDLISTTTGHNILYGNLGNDTLVGGTGGDIIRGGQGDDSIVAGSGAEWISGDRGDDTIQAGSGADTFHTFAGAGHDVVYGFDAAKGDHVLVDPGTHYTLSQVGADTVIDMGDGDEMVLKNVQLSALPQGWIFGA